MNNDVELIPVKGVLPSVQVQSDNVIYVPQAHKNKAGIVKEGDGVLIENGVVSLNKQTVEDMIDANKWVSYGFQQNLTEDEKGMARHNIGAGDNYFTGSYYDLTQKPHLNTNNTTGLDYGDEELNDTINLHKISKTGSFNDLKHVPQETLDFAESERQKSKNLFDYTKTYEYSSCSSNGDGSYSVNYTNFYYPEMRYKYNFKVGTTYHFSLLCEEYTTTAPYVQFTARFVYTDGGGGENSVNLVAGERASFSLTPQKEVDYLILRTIRTTVSATTTGKVSDIQIEEGSVATDYQPYHGQITHNDDAPVTFAESERQKSKNLFDYAKFQQVGRANYYLEVNVGSSIGVYAPVGTSAGIHCWIEQYDENKTLLKQSNYWGDKFILQLEPTTKYLRFDTVSDYAQFMICYANSVDEIENYQPYNGAIVHKKDIADVEHIETIYDVVSGKTSLGGSDYGSGIQGGITVENIDFSKYKKVKIYTKWFNALLTPIVIDFSVATDAILAGNALYRFDNDFKSICCKIQNKNTLIVNGLSYNSGSPETENVYYFVVSKIEGVY